MKPLAALWRNHMAWGAALILASQSLACDAEILRTCVDSTGKLDGTDAVECSSELVGETSCGCDGWQVRCEAVKTKTHLTDYLWRGTGSRCPSSGVGGASDQAGGSPGGAGTGVGGVGTGGTAGAQPSVDSEGAVDIDRLLSPGFARMHPHTTEQVIDYLNVLLSVDKRLGLEPGLEPTPLSYQGPCQHVDDISAGECVQGPWTLNYVFHEFPDGDTVFSADATTGEQMVQLNAEQAAAKTSNHYSMSVQDADDVLSLSLIVSCPGSGITIDDLQWRGLHVTRELIPCP
jgi:hypothetical protein